MVTVPAAFKYALMFLATATGLTVSATVTVAVPVFTFPLLSVTVKVTVFIPTFEQVKVLGKIVLVDIPHASLEPLSICDAVMLALPDPFNCTVMFCVNTTGLTVSDIVTVAVPVFTLPLLSVTVKVTVFTPVFEQAKLFGNTVILAIPHASFDPLST